MENITYMNFTDTLILPHFEVNRFTLAFHCLESTT